MIVSLLHVAVHISMLSQMCVSWIPIHRHASAKGPFRCNSPEGSAKMTKRSNLFVGRSDDGDDGPPPVFPFSMRLALVEKAKKLDGNLAKGKERGMYSSAGWLNWLGTVLTPASIPGVYTGDRPFYWNKIDVGCRMTVIQLPKNIDGKDDNNHDYDLWVHSPVRLDRPLMDALDELGTVKYIVSPNYEHLKFASQWAEAYPNAYLWGCPGLKERLPQLTIAGEIPFGFRPSSWNRGMGYSQRQQQLDSCWDLEEIQPLHINAEINPFTGKPFFNEVIFYHKSSKTLMATDFYWNYPQSNGIPNSHLTESPVTSWELAPAVDSIPVGSKLWKIGMDRVYHPFYNRFMIQSRTDYDNIVDFVIKDWDTTTLIPAHGDII